MQQPQRFVLKKKNQFVLIFLFVEFTFGILLQAKLSKPVWLIIEPQLRKTFEPRYDIDTIRLLYYFSITRNSWKEILFD